MKFKMVGGRGMLEIRSIPAQMRRALRLLPLAALFVLNHQVAAQQDASAFFKQNCTSCHTIGGGRLTGPDLKDVTARKDRAWLIQFLQSPKSMIDSGDSYAVKLQQEARGVVMPNIAGMNQQQAQALLDMISAESKLSRSQFAGMQISDRPLTPQDVTKGKQIFLGEHQLSGGGPACISCHTIKGLALLGGGRLGPISPGSMSGSKDAKGWRRGCPHRQAPPCHPYSKITRSSPMKSYRSWPCLKTRRKKVGRMTPLRC